MQLCYSTKRHLSSTRETIHVYVFVSNPRKTSKNCNGNNEHICLHIKYEKGMSFWKQYAFCAHIESTDSRKASPLVSKGASRTINDYHCTLMLTKPQNTNIKETLEWS